MTFGRLRPAILAVALVAAACTGGGTLAAPTSPPATTVRPGGSAPKPPKAHPLCDRTPPPETPVPTTGASPPAVLQQVADQVEEVRGLRFIRPVVPEPVSQSQIGGLLQQALDAAYPPDVEAARGRAWITMGLIPPGTDLHQAIENYAGSQIIGFYDTVTHQLVFAGSDHPTPYQRMTLAHELTHALDDQHFNLGRLDRLQNTCQDERLQAFTSLAEGDAVSTQLAWARRFLSPAEMVELQREAGSFPPPPATVPPFVRDLLAFPYPTGQGFVASLQRSAGEGAVNAAFEHPPLSTEQVLHPSKFASDEPQTVAVPEIKEKLGGPWQDLDIEDVGEGWLRMMLELRLPQDQALTAADGWGGSEYRAWAEGSRVAVALETTWDTTKDAGEFASAMRSWVVDGEGQAASISQRGSEVDVLFASDQLALRDLEGALG